MNGTIRPQAGNTEVSRLDREEERMLSTLASHPFIKRFTPIAASLAPTLGSDRFTIG
jgi:hypothetical protein